ncbi:MAG: DNA-processing protein DprA [Eubacteriaceae bacterium]
MRELFIRNLIALNEIKGLGRAKIKRILKITPLPREIDFSDLIEIGKNLGLIPSHFNEHSKLLGFANKVLEFNEKKGINALIYDEDMNLPEIFNIEDYPLILFSLGNKDLLKTNGVGVIGSRKPSDFGYRFSYQIAEFLGKNHFSTISGLALGCDSAAHLGSLKSPGGTIAFLPSGLTNIYPQDNLNLKNKIIAQNGLLLSEYHDFEKIYNYKFIQRNRLQAALSKFMIVSDFSNNSGTIHTLKFAKQYRKLIYTINEVSENPQNGFKCLAKANIDYVSLPKKDLTNLILNYI